MEGSEGSALLGQLPNEAIRHILGWVPITSAPSVALTCKPLQRLVREEQVLESMKKVRLPEVRSLQDQAIKAFEVYLLQQQNSEV